MQRKSKGKAVFIDLFIPKNKGNAKKMQRESKGKAQEKQRNSRGKAKFWAQGCRKEGTMYAH